MSIIPVGRRREQINQGALQNQSILDSDLFKKFGQVAGTLVPPKERQQEQQPSDKLQETMNSSNSLDLDGQANRSEQIGMGEMPSGSSIAPAGGPGDGNGSLSPFLTSIENPVDQQEQFGTISIVNWVEKIVQGGGFVINVNKSGGRTAITILPDPANPNVGFNWNNWKQVLERLQQVGVEPESIEYKNNSATFTLDPGGANQKITKAKNRR